MCRSFVRSTSKVAAIAIFWLLLAAFAQAATITVNSLADDVFPDGTGAIFDINNAPIALASPKCTLRMAIASANLDVAVGGVTFGCASGSGADTIVFDAALNLATTPGTITLANKADERGAGVVRRAIPLACSFRQHADDHHRPRVDAAHPRRRADQSSTAAGCSTVSDGDDNVDRPVHPQRRALLSRARPRQRRPAACSRAKSVTLNDVIFESCESVGGATDARFRRGAGRRAICSPEPRVPTVSDHEFQVPRQSGRPRHQPEPRRTTAARSSVRAPRKVGRRHADQRAVQRQFGGTQGRDDHPECRVGDDLRLAFHRQCGDRHQCARGYQRQRYGGFQILDVVRQRHDQQRDPGQRQRRQRGARADSAFRRSAAR